MIPAPSHLRRVLAWTPRILVALALVAYSSDCISCYSTTIVQHFHLLHFNANASSIFQAWFKSIKSLKLLSSWQPFRLYFALPARFWALGEKESVALFVPQVASY